MAEIPVVDELTVNESVGKFFPYIAPKIDPDTGLPVLDPNTGEILGQPTTLVVARLNISLLVPADQKETAEAELVLFERDIKSLVDSWTVGVITRGVSTRPETAIRVSDVAPTPGDFVTSRNR